MQGNREKTDLFTIHSSCAMSILTEKEYFLNFFLDASPLLRLKALDPIRAYKVRVRIMV
jgi:hypothetical protein